MLIKSTPHLYEKGTSKVSNKNKSRKAFRKLEQSVGTIGSKSFEYHTFFMDDKGQMKLKARLAHRRFSQKMNKQTNLFFFTLHGKKQTNSFLHFLGESLRSNLILPLDTV